MASGSPDRAGSSARGLRPTTASPERTVSPGRLVPSMPRSLPGGGRLGPGQRLSARCPLADGPMSDRNSARGTSIQRRRTPKWPDFGRTTLHHDGRRRAEMRAILPGRDRFVLWHGASRGDDRRGGGPDRPALHSDGPLCGDGGDLFGDRSVRSLVRSQCWTRPHTNKSEPANVKPLIRGFKLRYLPSGQKLLKQTSSAAPLAAADPPG